ncbi:hypothetical protein CGMCC3_g12018 [Colletotrichum fructicola]|nr:uncharacterized protein CGMCC3_g12018 [Colletotrichum fructicola]KAE9571857.1 hypothetical protein CGMCC3_g12018 [Colletotrichum fructicola]
MGKWCSSLRWSAFRRNPGPLPLTLPLVALSSVWPTAVSRPSHRPYLLHFPQVTVLAAFPGFLLAGKYLRTVRKRRKVRPTGIINTRWDMYSEVQIVHSQITKMLPKTSD